MIPGSGRNFTLLSNAVRRGIRLRTICRSTRNGEPSKELPSAKDVFCHLVKERPDFFVAFASANSLYPLEVVGALEWTCLDYALRYNRADSRDVLKFGERSCIYIQFALD